MSRGLPRTGSALVVLALLALASGACRGDTSARAPWHLNPNMDNQPKYRAQAESAFFSNGATMRQPVEGTVARGALHADSALYRGVDAAGEKVVASPVAATPEVLTRGEDRYAIYCSPCHAENGRGRGALYERAGVQSGDMIGDARIRGLSDGEMFDVITHGVGLMAGYAYPIAPRDRWAIIAHVRQMQAEEPLDPAAAAAAANAVDPTVLEELDEEEAAAAEPVVEGSAEGSEAG